MHTFAEREEIPDLSRLIPTSKRAEHDCNLPVRTYVEPADALGEDIYRGADAEISPQIVKREDELLKEIDRQKRDLLALGVDRESKVYWEYESGATKKRPEFQKLVNVLQTGDTLAATEISRLRRSTQQLCQVMQLVQDRHLCL